MTKWVVPARGRSVSGARQRGVVPGRSAGGGLWHGTRRVDQRGAAREIVPVKQPLGHVDEIGIGHVEAAVGEGVLGGLEEEMAGFGGVAQGGEVEAGELAEDLAHGEGSGRGRTHAADLEAAIVEADGRALDHLVGGEIGEGEQAGIGLGAHRGDDVAGDGALVERCAAVFGDQAQGAGQLGIGQRRALGQRRPGRV